MREPVTVRSYRAVVDDVERRIYRVDRWRLPLPGGIELRAVLYTAGAFLGLGALAALPVFGQALAALPAGIRYLALPVLIGWALAAWRVDGRAPHHALWAVVRFALWPRTLAGVRSTRSVGAELAPVASMRVAPSGDEPTYRRGRVQGPARVVLRYPARLELDPRGRRARVSAAGKRVRPLAHGRELRVPDGGEVRFQ